VVAAGEWHAEGHPRPLISVIIPVYNVASYLTECLDSITRQRFKNVEIIAVDGASDDASGKILDERSQAEPRLAVFHADRIGPGRARNQGAHQATGEYIWFVDGDDVVPDGSLAAIADRIDASRPDLLFIDHEDVYPDGKSVPGSGHDLLGRAAAECFTLAEQPRMLELSMASWNKIIRREFFVSTHAAFLAEYPHEDIGVSCLLLLEARRLSILNQVCYRYRKDRAGSAMAAGAADRHFNIFRSYGLVLDQARDRAGDSDLTADVQSALFDRAIWHYTTIFDTGGLVRDDDRRQFFERMHRHFADYVPAGYHYVPGLRGLKYRLIAADAYRAYNLLDPMNKIRVKAEHGIRNVRRQAVRRSQL
jgi:CDP-glycerol glycerophosphotransferase